MKRLFILFALLFIAEFASAQQPFQGKLILTLPTEPALVDKKLIMFTKENKYRITIEGSETTDCLIYKDTSAFALNISTETYENMSSQDNSFLQYAQVFSDPSIIETDSSATINGLPCRLFVGKFDEANIKIWATTSLGNLTLFSPCSRPGALIPVKITIENDKATQLFFEINSATQIPIEDAAFDIPKSYTLHTEMIED